MSIPHFRTQDWPDEIDVDTGTDSPPEYFLITVVSLTFIGKRKEQATEDTILPVNWFFRPGV